MKLVFKPTDGGSMGPHFLVKLVDRKTGGYHYIGHLYIDADETIIDVDELLRQWSSHEYEIIGRKE